MPKGKRLVTQHLEGISWRILEEYPVAIKELIRRQSGVYALYRREKLYYVGLASNLMGRLKSHLRDRHNGAWDRFSVYLTVRDEHIKELESLILRITNPVGNKQSGMFVKSENLYSTLNRKITAHDADKRAVLLGGRVAKRRQRTKAKKAKGKGALKGLINRRKILKAWKDGYEYTASLRLDGTIQYDGEKYESPNSAAKAAMGRPANGWRFWKYKNEQKEWVSLSTLKK